jgi:RNA polymerase sigma-32 factor
MASTDNQASGADRKFVKLAMAAPMLEREHELNLARRWRDDHDEDALHELCTAYMRLVVAVASRFRHYGLPMSDLVQEGNVGLMLAAARFEPERELRFFNLRHVVDPLVRAGLHPAQLVDRAHGDDDGAEVAVLQPAPAARPAARSERGRACRRRAGPMWRRSCASDEKDVDRMAARLSASDRSLNAPIGEDGEAEWQDLLADETALPEDETMLTRDRATRSAWLAEALADLTEREMMIIRERRLVEDGVTLESLGQKLGVSKERVRQIEHQALNKLKSALMRIVGDPEEAGLIPAG